MDLFSLQKKYMGFIDSWDCLALWLLTRSLDEKTYNDLYNMFPKNKKTKYKRVCNALEMLGRELAVEVAFDLDLLAETQDDFELIEILETENIKEVFIYCDYKTIDYIERMEI
ncbi:MAG: hypothetical protein ACTSV7_00645 [Candidatus Baldrarchaeia archaeon]